MHLSSKTKAIWDGTGCALQTVKQVVRDIEGILISSDFSSTKLLKAIPFDIPVASDSMLVQKTDVLTKYQPFHFC